MGGGAAAEEILRGISSCLDYGVGQTTVQVSNAAPWFECVSEWVNKKPWQRVWDTMKVQEKQNPSDLPSFTIKLLNLLGQTSNYIFSAFFFKSF